jgi:hypothetical protein
MQNNYQQYLLSLATFMNHNMLGQGQCFPFQFTTGAFGAQENYYQ